MAWTIDSNARASSPLDAKASVSVGDALDIRRLRPGGAVKILGTFSASIDVRASLDGGASYDTIATFTAPGHVILEGPYDRVLLDTTAYTSGAPAALVVGEWR